MPSTLTSISLVCALLLSAAASAQPAPAAGAAAVSGEPAATVYPPSHSEAAARPPSDPLYASSDPAPVRSYDTYWYGWQPLIADAVGLGLIALDVAAKVGVPTLLGLAIWGLVPPWMHGMHGNGGLAAGQVALRILAGCALSLGFVIKELTSDPSGMGTAMLVTGAAVGVLSILLDAAFGYEDVKPAPTVAYALRPWADPRGNAGLQLTAAF